MLYPNYFTHSNHISTKEYPLLNTAFESYFTPQQEENTWLRNYFGLSDAEKVNLALAENNLSELIDERDDEELLMNAIKLKGDYLIQQIKTKTDKDKFDAFIHRFFVQNRFQEINFDTLKNAIYNEYGLQLDSVLNQWYYGIELPAYVISDVEQYRIVEGEREKYQLLFTIENTKNVDGIIEVALRLGNGQNRNNRRRRRFSNMNEDNNPSDKYIYAIDANERKKIGIVLHEQIRQLNINTLISQNLPMNIEFNFDKPELKKNAAILHGQKVLPQKNTITENAVIVDNEDSGFTAFSPQNLTYLKQLISKNNEKEKYSGLNTWRPPTEWTLNTNSSYFGDYVRSAHYIRSGDGNAFCSWQTYMNKKGYYEVYAYIPLNKDEKRRNRQKSERRGTYLFTIYHADGTEETELNLGECEHGWNFIGTYYLENDTARVVLTNKSKEKMVIADAVKWIKRRGD